MTEAKLLTLQWQPIESAPKDGTWFLICREGDGYDSYEIGCYDPSFRPEYVEQDSGLYRKIMVEDSWKWRGFNNIHRATHWASLPEPPQ